MDIRDSLPRIDHILDTAREDLGDDFVAYRNHVYRVVHLAAALCDADGDALDKLSVAGAFHDLGIWTDRTWDYLEPSAARAQSYLESEGKPEWVDEVREMICNHHKITAWRRPGGARSAVPLVEAFRQADWIDVTLGIRRFGVDKAVIRPIVRAFPNAGFHRRLRQLTIHRLLTRPLRPLPMFRW